MFRIDVTYEMEWPEDEIVKVREMYYDTRDYQDCFVYIEITTLKMDEGTHYRIDYSVFSYEEAAVALGIKEFMDQQAEQSVENDL